MKTAALFTGVLALALLAGCGGGGGPPAGGAAEFDTFDLLSIPSRDGMISSNGVVLLDEHPTAGDDPLNKEWRGLYSFDILAISVNAAVESATLTLYQDSFGGEPYDELGTLSLDHVFLGPNIDAPDFNGGILDRDFARLPSSLQDGTRMIDVTAQVSADIRDGRSRSEYRLAFKNVSPDGEADWVGFTSDAPGLGQAPLPSLTVVTRR